MAALRQRVRIIAIAWLVCQVATLSAFVPDQCCASHAAEAAVKAHAPCHESAPAPPKNGDACPMHHGSRAHDCCAMKNSCNGPGLSLTTLFAFVGVLEKPVQSSIDLVSSVAFTPAPPTPRFRLSLPDAPPPKA